MINQAKILSRKSSCFTKSCNFFIFYLFKSLLLRSAGKLQPDAFDCLHSGVWPLICTAPPRLNSTFHNSEKVRIVSNTVSCVSVFCTGGKVLKRDRYQWGRSPSPRPRPPGVSIQKEGTYFSGEVVLIESIVKSTTCRASPLRSPANTDASWIIEGKFILAFPLWNSGRKVTLKIWVGVL